MGAPEAAGGTGRSSDAAARPAGKEGPKRSKLASVVSGSMSGALVSACVQPLDVVRTRMQADVAHGTFMSSARTVQAIMQHGGLRAMWQGTQPTVVRLGVGAGLHFFFLESIKPLLQTPGRDGGEAGMTAVGAALTGGLSRAMAAIVSCPITLVKTRMEYVGAAGRVPQYRNTVDALVTIARSEGVRGLYRGLGPTVMSNAPFSALYYMFYTRLQDHLKTGPQPSTVVNFVSGTVAAVAATLITQPADVIRTRVQLGMTGQVAAAAGAARPNSIQLLRHIVAAQGMRGVLAGAAPRMVKRTLQTALVWTLYEELVPRVTRAKDWLAEHTAAAAPGEQ